MSWNVAGRLASVLKNRIHNTSSTFFEVAISNFVCGCILMLEIAAYFFDICDLDLNVSSIQIVYGAYLLYYMTFWYVDTFLGLNVSTTVSSYSDLDLRLQSPEHICISFLVGIQNLVCRYIFGSQNITYCFLVILILASGLGLEKSWKGNVQ